MIIWRYIYRKRDETGKPEIWYCTIVLVLFIPFYFSRKLIKAEGCE